MFQVAKLRREPDVVPAAERRVGVVVVAREAARAGRRSRRRSRACAMLAIETSSTKTCGASATTPATSWKRAACSSAIEPPSLWPNSHGPLDAERARAAPAGPRAPARCMKSTPQRSSRRLRRRAAVAGARVDEARAGRARRRSAAGKSFHIATEPRPSCRKTTSGAGAARAPTHCVLDVGARGRATSTRRRAASTATARLTLGRAARSRSRSRKRWILPVAVFGSSSTNSIDARVLVRREPLLDEGLQLGVARRAARLEHDVGLGLGQAVGVLDADHRAPRAPPGAASASPRPRTARRRCR